MSRKKIRRGRLHDRSGETVAVPRIEARFLAIECKLERMEDLSGEGLTAMAIGRATHMAMDESYRKGLEDKKYSKDGYFICSICPRI